jgi:hypothetical protein
MNDSIWELANVSRSAGACLTGQFFAPSQQIQCLMTLLKLRHVPKSLIDEFNSLAGEIEAAGRKRNRLLHDVLALREAETTIARSETELGAVSKCEIVSSELKDLEELAATTISLTNRLDDLHLRIVARSRPWPRTQFEQSDGNRIARRAMISA